MRTSAIHRVQLESEIRRGVSAGEFVAYYQLVCNLRSRTWRGVEALARWNHPQGQIKLPAEFVPLAEERGIIIQLGITIMNLMSHAGLPPDLLVVEVTESTIITQLERTRHVLQGLRAIGVGIAVDDFGTGHSSIARLGQLPVDALKIDRSFTQHVGTDPVSARIVAAVIDLAHAHSLVTVAEGIESQAALDQVTRLGCDYAQGYHLGRPAPVPSGGLPD